MPRYSREPQDKAAYRRRGDRLYGLAAGAYDRAVTILPIWRRWLDRVLPYVVGPQVLEISFGTGYLLTRYAGDVEAHGIDLNARMVAIATQKVRRAGLNAELRQGDPARHLVDRPVEADR